MFLAGAAGTAAIYDTNTKIWTKGFDFPINPSGYICHPQDGLGTLLPNGNVLLACPGGFGTPACGFQNGPVYWYEFVWVNLNLQQSPLNIVDCNWYAFNMLLLLNGQVLQTRTNTHTDNFYTPTVTTYSNSW